MKEQDRNLEYFDDLDKLESLKQEYNNIPVPEAAKARIMSGIQKGKTMNKKHNPFFRILRTTGTTAAAAVVALAIVTNVSPTIANAMTNLPVIGAIAKVVTLRTYEDKTNHFEAKVDIPEIDSAPEAVNRSIEDKRTNKSKYVSEHKDRHGRFTAQRGRYIKSQSDAL